MYTTQTNRQRERQLDREEEEVATDRSMYVTQNNRYREIVRQRAGAGGYRQVGGKGSYRQMYTIDRTID